MQLRHGQTWVFLAERDYPKQNPSSGQVTCPSSTNLKTLNKVMVTVEIAVNEQDAQNDTIHVIFVAKRHLVVCECLSRRPDGSVIAR